MALDVNKEFRPGTMLRQVRDWLGLDEAVHSVFTSGELLVEDALRDGGARQFVEMSLAMRANPKTRKTFEQLRTEWPVRSTKQWIKQWLPCLYHAYRTQLGLANPTVARTTTETTRLTQIPKSTRELLRGSMSVPTRLPTAPLKDFIKISIFWCSLTVLVHLCVSDTPEPVNLWTTSSITTRRFCGLTTSIVLGLART